MKRKYKILGIAPYENLRNAMVMAAEKYEEIELTAFTGNLDPELIQVKAFHMIDNGLYSVLAEKTEYLEERYYIFCLE